MDGDPPGGGSDLHHGRVVTVNQQFAIAEAVAVKDGRIAAVGTNAEILRLKKPGTTRVDLAGKMVLPGLIDSHVHSTGASMYEFDHPIPDMESIADVLAYVRAGAAAPRRASGSRSRRSSSRGCASSAYPRAKSWTRRRRAIPCVSAPAPMPR